MNYSNINKIFRAYTQNDCNLFLSYGWILVNIENPTYADGANESVYVLGFPGKRDDGTEVKPTYPPKKTEPFLHGGEVIEKEVDWD